MSGYPLCACGCGTSLVGLRADAVYASEACAKRFKRAHSADKDRTGARGGNVRSVAEARALQEQSEEKARWTLIIREHIARTLIETGFFHADDLDELGVPAEHCNLIGSQIASFANRKQMAPTGATRKVAHRAANGRRAPIYRITEKGRKELAGVGSSNVAGSAGLLAAAPALDGRDRGKAVAASLSTATTHSGENGKVESRADSDPAAARLFDPPAPEPLSAVRHPEAA